MQDTCKRKEKWKEGTGKASQPPADTEGSVGAYHYSTPMCGNRQANKHKGGRKGTREAGRGPKTTRWAVPGTAWPGRKWPLGPLGMAGKAQPIWPVPGTAQPIWPV